jgi:hypothetical protein
MVNNRLLVTISTKTDKLGNFSSIQGLGSFQESGFTLNLFGMIVLYGPVDAQFRQVNHQPQRIAIRSSKLIKGRKDWRFT